MEDDTREEVIQLALRNMMVARAKEEMRLGLAENAFEVLGALLIAAGRDKEARTIKRNSPLEVRDRFFSGDIDSLSDDDVRRLYDRVSQDKPDLISRVAERPHETGGDRTMEGEEASTAKDTLSKIGAGGHQISVQEMRNILSQALRQITANAASS